eukprot:CAMPEP_0119570044 /NCGR_PEP_ID=MMETSP1352-20130426/43330_1 /TAXON_ID=265584 /ORGANISM="Stauroneis constricta, Strain CCMP1120" /LENGTH=263 /DNA_ID=CAMNT_0007619705 /DNA_START=146 /DNA_END=937 /DNA_ORIENTATION=-
MFKISSSVVLSVMLLVVVGPSATNNNGAVHAKPHGFMAKANFKTADATNQRTLADINVTDKCLVEAANAVQDDDICTCSAPDENGIVVRACEDTCANICNEEESLCGRVTTNYTYDVEGKPDFAVAGFDYVFGQQGRVAIEFTNATSCTVKVSTGANGELEACKSCGLDICGNSTDFKGEEALFSDCSNLPGGAKYDQCTNSSQFFGVFSALANDYDKCLETLPVTSAPTSAPTEGSSANNGLAMSIWHGAAVVGTMFFAFAL